MSAAERSTILLRSGKPFRNRWNRGGIGISIWKQRIFGMRLQREKILCAPSGRKSIIALISNSSGCVYGKRRITGSHYEDRSILVGIPLFAGSSSLVPHRVVNYQHSIGCWTLIVET